MNLLMLPKAKKPDHFACKMGFKTSHTRNKCTPPYCVMTSDFFGAV